MNLLIACKFLLTNDFYSHSSWMSSPQVQMYKVGTSDERIKQAKVEAFDLKRGRMDGGDGSGHGRWGHALGNRCGEVAGVWPTPTRVSC